jgi:hypothetical protein
MNDSPTGHPRCRRLARARGIGALVATVCAAISMWFALRGQGLQQPVSAAVSMRAPERPRLGDTRSTPPARTAVAAGHPLAVTASASAASPLTQHLGFAGKLLRWRSRLEIACGTDLNVTTMVEEAETAYDDVTELAASSTERELTTREARAEQQAHIRRLLDRWCRERAPQTRTLACRKWFSGYRT